LTPTWNASFDYQFMSSPGNFKNNNASHSGMRLSSGFSTKNRRYSGFFAYLTNRNSASQNGGIASDTFLQSKNTAFYTRFNIPTWLGGDGNFGTNFFATGVTTGNRYRQQQIFFRHQYDLGQKDSLINAEDSSVIRIFYPRLRLQHTLNYQTQEFSYFDNLTETDANYTAIYTQRFGFTPIDLPIGFKDKWTEVTNEAALILFPEKNNQEQFLKLGAGYQILQAQLGLQSQNFNNLYVLGEYRNRTRNRKWDINAFGRLYLSGLNAGNYTGSLSLERNLGQRLGILKVGFLNTNRTPGFVFDDRSSFPALDNSRLGTENWTRVSGNLYIPRLQLSLAGNYYLVSNYTFFKDYLRVSQAGLLSILHLSAEKKIKISRRWNWYAQLHIQQGGSNEINLPPLYTRHKLAYEAVLYKNLNLSTGVELRYFLPFSADDFNPLNQQWVVQNNQTISNRPDIHAFLHLRIRSFRLFARAENLNTLDISRGFGFLENNLAAPLYPTPGLFIRLGIYWTFVN
ncbi:MAG TPA: hypothetical protein PKD90_13850, partial [Phnomibacter sp.]|nr:hypothetical protein [Phnomibacter sp.]